MTCVPAPSCKAALTQATELAPNRSKLSDGICASPQHHEQNPDSDHETGEAWDLTNDPEHGCDVDALFAGIIERRDPRVKYLIRNRRICRSYDKPGIPAWTWAEYTGPNPHIKHGHCSIVHEARDDVAPWFDPAPNTEDIDMFIYSINNGTASFLFDGFHVVGISQNKANELKASGIRHVGDKNVEFHNENVKAATGELNAGTA